MLEIVRGAGAGAGMGEGVFHRALAVGEEEAGVDPEEPLHARRVAQPRHPGARVEGAEGGAGRLEVLRDGGEGPLPAVFVAAGGPQPQEAPVDPSAQRHFGRGPGNDPGDERGFDPAETAQPLRGQHLGRIPAAPLRQRRDAGPGRGQVGSGGG